MGKVVMQKKCGKCKALKAFSDFNKNRCQSFGLSNYCRECSSELWKINNKKINERLSGSRVFAKEGNKICSICKVEKSKSEFNSNKARSTGTYSECKICRKNKIKYPKSSDYISSVTPDQLSKERWVDLIINNELFPYQISDCGRVKLQNGRIAKLSLDGFGYPQIVVSKNGVRVGRRVHVLVGGHFIANLHNLPELNHIDSNKFNPHFTNLEWSTSKQNTYHAMSVGLKKSFDSTNHPCRKAVINIITNEKYDSAKLASDATGLKYGTLLSKLNGRAKNKTNLRYL